MCRISDKVKLLIGYKYSAINSHPVFALYEIFIVSVEALLMLLTRCMRNMLTVMGKMRVGGGLLQPASVTESKMR